MLLAMYENTPTGSAVGDTFFWVKVEFFTTKGFWFILSLKLFERQQICPLVGPWLGRQLPVLR